MNRTERIMSRNRNRGRRNSSRGNMDIKNVNQALYRKDLEFNMTDQGYSQYQEDTARFNKSIAEANSKLSAADSQLNAYQKQLDESAGKIEEGQGLLNEAHSGTSLNGAWGEYAKSFKSIDVVDKQGKIEGTYYLPAEAVKEVPGSWQGGRFKVPASQEMHDALRNGSTDLKAKFYEESLGAVQKNAAAWTSAAGELNTARGQLEGQYAKLEGERASLASERDAIKQAEQGRQDQLDKTREMYNSSKSHRQALFAV